MHVMRNAHTARPADCAAEKSPCGLASAARLLRTPCPSGVSAGGCTADSAPVSIVGARPSGLNLSPSLALRCALSTVPGSSRLSISPAALPSAPCVSSLWPASLARGLALLAVCVERSRALARAPASIGRAPVFLDPLELGGIARSRRLLRRAAAAAAAGTTASRVPWRAPLECPLPAPLAVRRLGASRSAAAIGGAPAPQSRPDLPLRPRRVAKHSALGALASLHLRRPSPRPPSPSAALHHGRYLFLSSAPLLCLLFVSLAPLPHLPLHRLPARLQLHRPRSIHCLIH